MIRLIFTILSIYYFSISSAQLSFTKKTSQYSTTSTWSGIAGGFCDINGDLTDDLIMLNKGKTLQVGYNQGRDKNVKWSNAIDVFQNSEYALTIGDLDNDAIPEIIVNGAYSEVKVYKRNADGSIKLHYKVPTFIYSQSTNLVDINNDGFLDLFICNDEGDNLTLLNDKMGMLYGEYIIDFNTIPTSDNSGNYGSEWIDIDNDNDQDLYIAKCRFGVTDLEDPRRHNMLFINNNGTFTNEAEARGLKDKSQSWTGSFADFDNDGDFDCFISNHDANHSLMQNDGNGNFTPYPSNIPFAKTFSFQVIPTDYDNNGFVDILITAEDKVDLYLNQDGSNFIRTHLFSDAAFSSATCGDMNDDGFMDIQVYYSVSINLPGGKRDELFVNDGNANNYVKFTLRGTQSNASAVGAKIYSYSSSGQKLRQVQAGVSYGITNTLTQHFGMGSDEKIDSIKVIWPSGIIDRFSNLEVNEHFYIEEGGCISKRFELLQDKTILCNEDSIIVSSSIDFENYHWNNNATKETVSLFSPSSISLNATDANGCVHYSKLMYVEGHSLENQPLIKDPQDTVYLCKADSVLLEKSDLVASILWPNGDTSSSFVVNHAGDFVLSAIDFCGENFTQTVYVRNVIEETNQTLYLKKDADTTLVVKGNDVSWFSDEERTMLLSKNASINVSKLMDTLILYVTVEDKKGATSSEIGVNTLPVSNTFSSDNVDGGLYLNVFEDLTLKSFVVKTDRSGIRRFLIIRYEGDTIFSKDVMITKDIEQLVELNAAIPIGTLYQLKTDHTVNVQNLGYEGPRLYRSNRNVVYPYLSENVAEIPVSTKGADVYYYFFNMQLETGGVLCKENFEIVIIPDSISSSQDVDLTSSTVIYPNPAQKVLYVKGENIVQVSIFNLHGQKVLTAKLDERKRIGIESLSNGIYLVELMNKHHQTMKYKLIVHEY